MSGDPDPVRTGVVRRAIESTADLGARIEAIDVGRELLLVECVSPSGDRSVGVSLDPGSSISDVVGRTARDVVEAAVESTDPGVRAAGIATLNALAGRPPEARPADPFAMLEPSVERIAMVGLFGPVFRYLPSVHVHVFEREPGAVSPPTDLPDGVSVELHSPSEAEAVVPVADVVFVTGSTLVYGGLTTYVRAARPDQPIVVVGASASFAPLAFFEAGIPVVAGAAVTDADRVRRAVSGGDSQSILHGEGLEKWLVVDPSVDELPGLGFDREA